MNNWTVRTKHFLSHCTRIALQAVTLIPGKQTKNNQMSSSSSWSESIKEVLGCRFLFSCGHMRLSSWTLTEASLFFLHSPLLCSGAHFPSHLHPQQMLQLQNIASGHARSWKHLCWSRERIQESHLFKIVGWNEVKISNLGKRVNYECMNATFMKTWISYHMLGGVGMCAWLKLSFSIAWISLNGDCPKAEPEVLQFDERSRQKEFLLSFRGRSEAELRNVKGSKEVSFAQLSVRFEVNILNTEERVCWD